MKTNTVRLHSAISKAAILSLALVVSLFILSGCGSAASKYKDALSLLDEGKYKEARSIFLTIPEYEDSARYLKDLVVLYGSETKTDKNGKLLSSRISEYDDLGNILSEITTESTNETYIHTYEYNSNGDLIKYSKTYPDGRVYYRTYEYDDKGNLIKRTAINSSGNVSNTNVYEYDNSEAPVKNIYTRSDGRVDISEYEYDSMGNRSKVVYRFPSGMNSRNIWINEYEYDSMGNMLTNISTRFLDGEFRNSSETIFEYNIKGYQTSWIFRADGQPSSTDTFEYDSFGSAVKVMSVVSNGNASTTTYEYEYDDYGNVLKKVYTHSGGYTYTIQYTDPKVFYKPEKSFIMLP